MSNVLQISPTGPCANDPFLYCVIELPPVARLVLINYCRRLPSTPQVRNRVLRNALPVQTSPLSWYCRRPNIPRGACPASAVLALVLMVWIFRSAMTVSDQGDSDLLTIAEGNTA
jgi:hypothetical protein